MNPHVALSSSQERLLDQVAASLSAPKEGWPSSAHEAARRVSVAMKRRTVPESEDLCRVLLFLLDADLVRGCAADAELSRTPKSVAVEAAKGLRTILGLPEMGSDPKLEVVGKLYVYFPES